jgi:hypothetical protein
MKQDIYCGIEKLSSHQKRGTMKECIDNKQVNYWGLKKIDKKQLHKQKKHKLIIPPIELKDDNEDDNEDDTLTPIEEVKFFKI